MKKIANICITSFFIIMALILFSSCSKDNSPTGDSDGKTDINDGGGSTVSLDDTRDAYETLIEFAVAKQIMLYEYVAVMTDDFEAGFAENDLTYEQVDRLFESIYSLSEYEQDVENALAIIEIDAAAKPAGIMATEGLGKALRDFISWLPGSAAHSRNRILQVASNMSADHRTILYNSLRPEWKSQMSSENDFWKKLEDGDLDYKAPQMYNDFYENEQNKTNFGILSTEKGLTINKIAHREGAEGVTKGAQLMVEVTKAIAPSTAKGMDLVEKADEYKEKAQKAYLDPEGFIKDEIKSKIAGKIGEYIDVDGAVKGGLIAEGTAEAVKATSDIVFGTDEPSKLAEQGIDWGIAKIKQLNESAEGADIALAQSAETGKIPSAVIALAAKSEDIRVVVPKGKWDVSVVTEKGKSETHEDQEIESGEEKEIEAPMTYSITVSPDSDTAEVGSAVNFSATVKGTPPKGAIYEWTFGDNSTSLGNSWNGAMSKTYSKAGTYTVKVQIKSTNGEILAEDTAEAVITNPADTTVTSYLHQMKNLSVYFSAAYQGPDGVEARSIVIDTRNYSSDIVWDGLSFSISYSEGDTYGTIRGQFTSDKYKIATLDVSEHEVYNYWIYDNGFPVDSEEWIYDKDLIVNDLPIAKYSQYGVNGLSKIVEGSDASKYVNYAKFVSTSPDPEEDPKTFSTVDWSNKNDPPALKIYFFDH